jgi:hypothetical protein
METLLYGAGYILFILAIVAVILIAKEVKESIYHKHYIEHHKEMKRRGLE